LASVYFTDSSTGWAVGNNGLIIKTTDGGEHWFVQYSGAGFTLHSVFFIDSNTGWTVGDVSEIDKTTNGGLNWERILESGYPNFLFCQLYR